MSLYPELDDLNLEELKKRWYGLPVDGKSYANSYYSEVAFKLSQKGDDGKDFLLSEITKADTARLGAILAILPSTNCKLPLEMLVNYLRDRRVIIKSRAVDALSSQREKTVRNEVLNLYSLKSPYVKGSVLRYMSHLFLQEAIPMLIEALKDPHYIVRENAVDELDDFEVVEALPHIKPLLKDPHLHVREAAETAIEHLASRKDEAPKTAKAG